MFRFDDCFFMTHSVATLASNLRVFVRMVQVCMHAFFFNVSNDKNLGWLFHIGDEKLTSYMGIIIHHYKDPY